MKQEIKTEDIRGFMLEKLEEKNLFASSTKEKKRLFIALTGVIQIEVDGFVVLETTDLAEAARHYNAI